MFYDISSLCPRTDICMGRHGFSIHLHPGFKVLVAKSGIDQAKVNNVIERDGGAWLDACGYKQMVDDENGKRRLYEPKHSIRVSWGEWGLEHITVPGNACGLDIERCGLGNPFGGYSLFPHNIDAWSQKQLLLIVFTYFAESMSIMCWEEVRKGLTAFEGVIMTCPDCHGTAKLDALPVSRLSSRTQTASKPGIAMPAPTVSWIATAWPAGTR